MKRQPMKSLSALILAAAALAASGCAMPKWNKLGKPTGEDVTPLRAERREAALQRFDTHRDNAQYQAAIDRWKEGDPFTCEAQLRSLVNRNPKHLPSRRALADLALERGDAAAAEKELRELLAIAPNDAQTHHSLGLLLESQDRADEARQYLLRAAELAPDNELFQLCAQGVKTSGS